MATKEESIPSRRRFDPLSWVWVPPRLWRRRGAGSDRVLRKTGIISILFHIIVICGPMLALIRGCLEPYKIPAGGGGEKQQRVAVQFKKVKRKKYIVDPMNPIFFNEPKIEEIDMQLDNDTTHAYKPGQIGGKGQGKGRGFGEGAPGGKIRFIRLKYRGGDWDQDMGINSDMNLLLEFFKRTGIPVKNHTEAIDITDLGRFPKKMKPPFVYITGARGIDVTEKEAKILRQYLLREGGMLFADNGGGSFDSSFRRLLRRVLPELDLIVIPFDDDIFQNPYGLPGGAPPLWHHSGDMAMGVKYRSRWVVFYHQGDLGDAWKTGHSGTSKESAELAYRLGVNVIQYSVVHYLEHIRQ